MSALDCGIPVFSEFRCHENRFPRLQRDGFFGEDIERDTINVAGLCEFAMKIDRGKFRVY